MRPRKIKVFLISGFFVLLTVFIGLSFKLQVKSHQDSQKNQTAYLGYDKVEPEVPLKFDYKKLLSQPLLKFEEQLDYKAKVNRFQGVALVAYKNQIIFEKAYGYSDPVSKIPLKLDQSFELASVSKQFTAASVLKLVELGKLSLNDKFADFYPNFKFKEITIKHLLKHSTGLWDYMNMTEAYWKEEKAPNQVEVIGLLDKHQTSLSFAPGQRFEYNNTNYALLVSLIEKLSGVSYRAFLQTHFLQDLCLDNTYVGVESRQKPNVVEAYQPYGRSFINLPPSFHNQALGDKGIHATADDLWRWFKALKNYKSLTQSSVEKLFNLHEYRSYDYGMGFRTKHNAYGELEIYHDGLWDGFRNGLHFFPQRELTFIVLSHTQNKQKIYFQNYLEQKAKQMLNQYQLEQKAHSTTES